MRLVIVESPYSGPNLAAITANVEYAKWAVFDCLKKGEAPIASHLLLAASGVLDDANPRQREIGLAAGWAWIPVCHACVVYVDRGVSEGMRRGIVAAFDAVKLVEFRTLERNDLRVIEERDRLMAWIDGLKKGQH